MVDIYVYLINRVSLPDFPSPSTRMIFPKVGWFLGEIFMVPCWFQPIGFLCASSIFLKVGEIPQSVFSDQTQNWRSVLNFAIITVIFGHNMLTFHKDWNDIAKKESQTWLFAM